jgi:hypothetical protein
MNKKTIAAITSITSMVLGYGVSLPAQAVTICGSNPKSVSTATINIDLRDVKDHFQAFTISDSSGIKHYKTDPMSGLVTPPTVRNHIASKVAASKGAVSRVSIPVYKCQMSDGTWKLQVNQKASLLSETQLWDIAKIRRNGKVAFERASKTGSSVGIGLLANNTTNTTILTPSFGVNMRLETALPPLVDWKAYWKGLSILASVASHVPAIGEYADAAGKVIDVIETATPPAKDTFGLTNPALNPSDNPFKLVTVSIDSKGNIVVPNDIAVSFKSTNVSFGGVKVYHQKYLGSKIDVKPIAAGMSYKTDVTGEDAFLQYTIRTTVN